jgi:hypothetical protein
VVVREEQGRAVGGRRLQRLRGDLAARAGAVVHHHRWPSRSLSFSASVRAMASVPPPGRKADQDADGVAGLGERRAAAAPAATADAASEQESAGGGQGTWNLWVGMARP